MMELMKYAYETPSAQTFSTSGTSKTEHKEMEIIGLCYSMSKREMAEEILRYRKMLGQHILGE